MTRPKTGGDAGFTLLEIVVAVGIFALLAGVIVQALIAGRRVLASSVAAGGASSSAAVDRFVSSLRDAAQSAIAVSATDDLAAPGYGGVKLVLYLRDDAGHASFAGFAQSGDRVYRLDYGAAVPGSAAPVSATLVDGVTSLGAATIPADRLAQRYGLSAAPHAVPLAAGGRGVPLPVEAGNHIVEVTLANGAGVTRTVHLAAGVMPSGFTITGTPVIHAVVYRVDNPPQCVRIMGFCVGTRTTGNVYGRVSVSYDEGANWHVWCPSLMLHANVYVGPNGFFTDTASDAGYNSNDPSERTSSLIAQCRAQRPAFPDVTSTDPPQLLATPIPIEFETAPPAGTIAYCTPQTITPACLDPTPPASTPFAVPQTAAP